MRFCLFCLIFPFLLSAQSAGDYHDKYVWAKSGLTMRDAGNANGKKLLVVPFGAAVTPTGTDGAQADVTALSAVSYRQGSQTFKSSPYIMYGNYIEVTYEGTTGYVYNGYLSAYAPGTGAGEATDFTAWLDTQFGTPATIDSERLPLQGGRAQQVMHYPGGAMQTNVEYEGGGSTTYVFPSGSINDGYLIAARFFGITDAVTEKGEREEDVDYLPELLQVKDDGTLEFTGEMSETIIRVVGELLIIYTAGGC